ncbi:MAG: flagellar filament capping protein FliD [Eubacteriales bacterium]|nr:flagellar filament capping protein FliD [Eubacteriales bacterium]MDD3199230.1 flagellar filament capping protein FliD [Eubacteriales bacterium]MDD4629361.1 flagellar filament capping protein FliD [Eubacteriales bacterium]
MVSVNSSTSASTTSLLTAKTGIGGLVSGMDIDELVESLSSSSRQKILKQQQNVQKLEWKQTAYRSVTTALKEFQGKYLDVLSKTNFRSESFFNTLNAVSSSDKIKVAAASGASAGSITINSVTKLAACQVVKSAASVSKGLVGKMESAVAGTMDSTDIDNLLAAISGKSVSITLDGKVKAVTFDNAFADSVNADKTPAGLRNALQAAVDSSFGVTDPADRVLTIEVNNDQLTFSATGSKVIIHSVGDDIATLDNLGFADGQSNTLTASASFESSSFAAGLEEIDAYKFTINSINFTVSKADSLAAIMNKINSSDAGVKISYSSITDKFTMTANESGAGEKIVTSDSIGNLMEAFGLTDTSRTLITAGENAVITVNGQQIIRNSNTMDIDGVKVTVSEVTDAPSTITINEDASSLLDSIKGFVEDYNSMISLVNGLTKEEINRDFQPLSDEQKEEMTESQIKTWEDKAKSGLLRGDSILQNISSKLHSVMTSTSIGGISLHSIGISSAGYGENGKLKIDETKLKEALQTKSYEIKELFISSKGIGNSLFDIVNSATKTSGVKGSRGTLVEVAGMASTMSDTENSIYEQIKRTNKTIKTMQIRLTAEESRLWSKFTAMESALNSLNVQSSILSQFSGGNS